MRRPDEFDLLEDWDTCQLCGGNGLLTPEAYWRREYCACPAGEDREQEDEDTDAGQEEPAGDWPTDEGLCWQAGRMQKELKR